LDLLHPSSLPSFALLSLHLHLPRLQPHMTSSGGSIDIDSALAFPARQTLCSWTFLLVPSPVIITILRPLSLHLHLRRLRPHMTSSGSSIDIDSALVFPARQTLCSWTFLLLPSPIIITILRPLLIHLHLPRLRPHMTSSGGSIDIDSALVYFLHARHCVVGPSSLYLHPSSLPSFVLF
jgi:hypothetical protein